MRTILRPMLCLLLLLVFAVAFSAPVAPAHAGTPYCDHADNLTPPGCVPEPFKERLFGCDVAWSFDGPMPWVEDPTGALIAGSWAIPNDDGLTYRVAAFVVVNPDKPVYLQLNNGAHVQPFVADKPPAGCQTG